MSLTQTAGDCAAALRPRPRLEERIYTQKKVEAARIGDGAAAWNAAVADLGGSVLQSHEWGEFRRRTGWRPLRLRDREGGRWAAQVLLKRLPGLGTLAYAPHGPLAADPADLPAAAAAVAKHARSHGAHLLEVEPRVAWEPGLEAEGFSRSPTSIQPRCTLVVPVLGSEEEQLAALPKDARYGIRRARDAGIEAETSGDVERDLEGFLDLLEETARRHRFAVRTRDYYRRFARELPARLVLARREGERRPVAGALILIFNEEAYYLYGASAHFEGKNLYASYLVQLEAMAAARREGTARYDLWGIPCNPHKRHPLWGVYRFKKKFAGPGREERYAGSYKKYLSPLQSHLARAGIGSYYTLQRLRGRSRGPIAD